MLVYANHHDDLNRVNIQLIPLEGETGRIVIAEAVQESKPEMTWLSFPDKYSLQSCFAHDFPVEIRTGILKNHY